MIVSVLPLVPPTGGLCYMGASLLLPKLHIDDPVEAFAVHGACARRARRRSVAGGDGSALVLEVLDD